MLFHGPIPRSTPPLRFVLLLPDDFRQNDEELKKKYIVGKVRIFQQSLEICQDLRALVEEAGTEEAKNLSAFAQRVYLSVMREDDTRDLDLHIDIDVLDATRSQKTKNGKLWRREGQYFEIDAEKGHEVIAAVAPPLREAIADYVLPNMQQRFLDDLDENGKYGEMEELREKFGELYEHVVDGKWPKRKKSRPTRRNPPGSL